MDRLKALWMVLTSKRYLVAIVSKEGTELMYVKQNWDAAMTCVILNQTVEG